MAPRRDFSAEYRRRNELARERGFPNYWAQRTTPRYPRSGRALGRFPEVARNHRSDAMHVLDVAAKRGLSIEQAAREEHLPVSLVRYYAGSGIERRGGVERPKRNDDLLRLRPMVIDGEVRFVEAHTRRSAAQADRIFDVQWRYAHGRAKPEELAKLPKTFHGQPVTRDPGDLIDVANRGMPEDVVDAYREALGSQP